MADFNTKVGDNNKNADNVMGSCDLGDKYENGEFLVDFCAAHRLVIGNTLFPHTDIKLCGYLQINKQQTNR